MPVPVARMLVRLLDARLPATPAAAKSAIALTPAM